tara:strand:- start:6488 stop:7540 length:1053 start_codon:yes stop_codon:yes gene_type:complete
MKLKISHKNFLDIINLYFKCFKPINNFVGKDDFLSIVNNFRTKNNTFFPMPIFLSINKKEYNLIKHKREVSAFYKSKKVCNLKIKSIFQINKKRVGEKIFQTKNRNHVGLSEFLKSGNYFVECSIIKFNKKVMKNINFSDPTKIKSVLLKKKFRNIVGFHTRNAPHKAHEWIHSLGLKKCKALLIQPLIGQFKKGEYKEKFVIRSNFKLINEIYENKNVFFALFNSYPRYAGPREAMFHAIVRKNFGCTHFLVGRDHAGLKNYYKKYDSQKTCLKFQKFLGIKIIPFQEPYLCKNCMKIINKKCKNCKKENKKFISGTFIRKKLKNKIKIPELYMDRKISRMLNKNSIIN